MVTVICNVCGRVWQAPVILGPVACPECGAKDVSVAVKQGRRKRKSRQPPARRAYGPEGINRIDMMKRKKNTKGKVITIQGDTIAGKKYLEKQAKRVSRMVDERLKKNKR